MICRPGTLAGAATLFGLSLLLPGKAGAQASQQWGSRVGVGYVVSAPNQYVGVSAHVLSTLAGGVGLYFDGKATRPSISSRENFESAWTSRHVDNTFGDLPFSDAHEYRSLNIALLRPMTPELMIYAGAGLTRRTVYVEYLDEERERGRYGVYWVEDTDAAAEGVNALAGAFFRIGRNMSLQFGFETQPGGVTVGAAYSLPLRR